MREEDDQLYIYKLYGISVPRRIRADKSLRSRIGVNTKISTEQIDKAQDIIDNPRVDFEEYAYRYLSKIEKIIDVARQESYMHYDEYEKITVPLTQIKGQAGMFGNPLASEISAMVLKFLEHYQRLDDDMLDILNVYCRMIRASYTKSLLHIETPGGRILIGELTHAMQRYKDKFKKMTGR